MKIYKNLGEHKNRGSKIKKHHICVCVCSLYLYMKCTMEYNTKIFNLINYETNKNLKWHQTVNREKSTNTMNLKDKEDKIHGAALKKNRSLIRGRRWDCHPFVYSDTSWQTTMWLKNTGGKWTEELTFSTDDFQGKSHTIPINSSSGIY